MAAKAPTLDVTFLDHSATTQAHFVRGSQHKTGVVEANSGRLGQSDNVMITTALAMQKSDDILCPVRKAQAQYID